MIWKCDHVASHMFHTSNSKGSCTSGFSACAARTNLRADKESLYWSYILTFHGELLAIGYHEVDVLARMLEFGNHLWKFICT